MVEEKCSRLRFAAQVHSVVVVQQIRRLDVHRLTSVTSLAYAQAGPSQRVERPLASQRHARPISTAIQQMSFQPQRVQRLPAGDQLLNSKNTPTRYSTVGWAELGAGDCCGTIAVSMDEASYFIQNSTHSTSTSTHPPAYATSSLRRHDTQHRENEAAPSPV